MDNKHNICNKLACALNWFGGKQLTPTFNSFRIFLLTIVCSIFTFGQLTAQSIAFSKTTLFGTSLSEPTSLDFGPDGRLYVSERTGNIYAYTVDKVGNNYQVLATELINLVKNIPNHDDDDGSFNSFVNERQVTGILVIGTPANPIIYASSSDVRIGGGGGSDTNLDTNSGMISRLTNDGASWQKVDLIRGLPRSEENHATNGMQYDAANNILIVAQGGNTNAGAPSANFDHLCEYALSATILEVDLTMLDAMPVLIDPNSGQQYIYDIPTLDDPTRPNDANGKDINDPFGGNDGLNQSKYIPGGPISIFSGGYRNQYDVVLTELGHLYTWDNGPNGGIGGHPDNEGSPNVTNNWVSGEPGSNSPGPNDAKVNNKDGLHKVTEGYYAGHPTPIRANPLGAGLFTHENGPSETGTFRTAITGNPLTTLPVDWPPYPDSLKDLREADYQNPGVTDGSIYVREASTNGMAEYTANAFGGAMKGDLLAVSFSGDVLRVDLDANGDLGPDGVTSIGNQLGVPLDVTSLPNNSFFAGTIWVAEFSGNSIAILEPTNNSTCLGTDDDTIDEDGDLYTNADEIQNGSDPCNPAITPPDFDKSLIGAFRVSNLNDLDDDDDGLLDNVDPFAQDAFNGLNTTIPLTNRLANGTSGLLDLGFTGLMTNGTTDYLDLIFNENEIIAGGAPELLVIPGVSSAVALGNTNNEVNAFQFGVKVDAATPSFTVSGKIVPPFLGTPPTNNQQHGIYIGSGDQDNYIKIVLHANNGTGQIQVIKEISGSPTINNYVFSSLLAAAELELSLSVNPANGTIQPMLSVNGSNTFPLGSGPISTSGSLLNAIQNTNVALAVGITASAVDAGAPFTAIWDDINILFNDPNALVGQWETINDGSNCAPFGSPGSCPTQRHETAYIEVGDKFYVVGGRETNTVNIYDPLTDVWTEGATAPINLHHFQSLEYQGLIYVMGAFTGDFPNDAPVPNIYIYDPAMDTWTVGPEIPLTRRRGAAAAVTYKGKIYLAGGIQDGHNGGRVAWLDEYDPTINTWVTLADAPNDRDHVQAIIFDDKLYLVAGKQTNLGGNLNATISTVDVYDFTDGTWASLPNPIPTPRGGNSVALLGNEILAIGGESVTGNGLNKTEALNLDDNTWRTLPNLNQGRHGTQAIVNNGVIYITAGSPIIGGGNSKTQEVFYFTQKNLPVLTPISQSVLVSEGENLNALNTLQFANATESIVLKNTVGNQGIIITDIDFLTGTSPEYSFTLSNNIELPLVLAIGDSLTINVNNSSANPADGTGTLIINHSGVHAPQTSIVLNNPICVDSDNDGFCVDVDCNDNDPTVPTAPGTLCNDGNPNTDNDMILADGCTCQGSGGGIVDCNGVLFLGGAGQITVDNLLALGEVVEIIGEGTGYIPILICDQDCDDTQIIPNLLPGTYAVKVNMFGSDNSYCYREENVIVTSGPCIDVDNDGICANVDCDDTNPNFPMIVGTSCDDGNSATTNDVILADGCTCAGTIPCPTDADNDGVCFNEDCDDNNPNVPTVPGTACDDGDINTVGDVIQADGCTCAGSNGGPANCDAVQVTGGSGQITINNLTAASEIIEIIGSSTNWQIVGVCNDNCGNSQVVSSLMPGFYTVKINMFGDDNSYCYTQAEVEVTDGPCPDIDNDGVCAVDDCDDNNPNIPAPQGTSCDDGDINTTNDVIQADGCTCEGIFVCPVDSDNDGICAVDDCDDNNPDIPAPQGTSCDDGDINTINDVIQADGCTCAGIFACLVDVDNDGVCAPDDCDDNDPNVPAPQGTSCDDGNSLTNNDIILADGCTCAGTPCTDADNDGICIPEDCDDTDPLLPAVVGSTCDDGDPNTTGDVIQADGCTCAGNGGGPADCDGVQFAGGNGIITLNNLTAASEEIEIIGSNTNWTPVLICAESDACSDPYIIPNLIAGIYTVKIQMFGDDNSYCYRQEDVVVTDGPCTDADNDGVCVELDCDDNDPNIPTTGGTACNDGDPNTTNDVILTDGCTCQGTIPCAADVDGDGVCADVDCDDSDPNLPTSPGTACDDGDANTQGDVIQADGCTCAGSSGGPANCENVQFIDGVGEITLTNLTALNEKIEIIGSNTNWTPITICDDTEECSNPYIIPNLAPGVYTVKLQMFGEDNSYCFRQEDVTVTAPSVAPAAANRVNKILAFAAYPIEQHVEMEWLNNTGYMNDHFVIERSKDGEIFEPIVERRATDDSDQLNRFVEFDPTPFDGENYYRLKIVYEDGSHEYTSVQNVDFARLSDFDIFPNPAENAISIALKRYLGKDVSVAIKDQLGRTMYQKELVNLSTPTHPISLLDFENGLYIVQVQVAGQKMVAKKLIVSKLR